MSANATAANTTTPAARIAAALGTLGIHAPVAGCATWPEYARIIVVAALNFAAGRRKRRERLRLSLGARVAPRRAVRLSHEASRTPKGGVTIGGTFYPGGEFIPGEVLAGATAAERARVAGGAATRDPAQASVLVQHASDALRIGQRHLARAADAADGSLKGLARASRLLDLVDRHARLAFELRAKRAGLDHLERAHLDRALAHMLAHEGAARAAVVGHARAHLAALPDAPPPADPGAARRALLVDLAAFPADARPAVEELARKAGDVGAFGLGTLRLVARPRGQLAKVWDALQAAGAPLDGPVEGVGGETAADHLELLWERSRAPVQFAIADVPERARGSSPAGDDRAPDPGDAVRYKRLSRDLMLRHDPAAGDHAIIRRADAPETIGVPAWAQTDAGEPPPGSGYPGG